MSGRENFRARTPSWDRPPCSRVWYGRSRRSSLNPCLAFARFARLSGQYRREASAKKQSRLSAGGGAVAKKGDTGDMDEGEGDGDQGAGGDGEADDGMGDDADGGDRERDGGDIAQQINSGAGSAANNGSSSSAEAVKMEMDRRQSAGLPQGSVGGGFPMEEDASSVVQVVGAPVASVAASAGGMIPQEIAGSETNAG